jgi:hypothetical protein
MLKRAVKLENDKKYICIPNINWILFTLITERFAPACRPTSRCLFPPPPPPPKINITFPCLSFIQLPALLFAR